MVKPYFTRKNLIFIALTFFYALIIVFTGICIAGGDSAVLSDKNIVNLIGQSFGFASIELNSAILVTLILIAIYIVAFVTMVAYERRFAIVNNKKPTHITMILLYAGTFILSVIFSLGVGLILQINLKQDIKLLLQYIGQSMVLGSLLYLLLFGLLAFATMLVVNFINVDKPFKFWDKKEKTELEDIKEEVDLDVSSSFDANTDVNANGPVAGGVAAASGAGGGSDLSTVKKVEELDDREKVFPALSKMDLDYDGYAIEKIESDDLSLQELCERFRNYLAAEEKLYFDIATIRVFMSAFAASHFMILEGLSGTGKSSLPRYFAKFVQGNCLFVPVQTTWRDKSSMFGYFNDFSKTYNETDFLVNLYRANYNPDQIHIFVLDEMNISRVEYYFADLLSVLEYPKDEWKLRLMYLPYGFIPPAKLDEGCIKITDNSYFVGTANKDDSTFSITDKVYDRAITIDFDYRNEAFIPEGECGKITLSKSKLDSLYKQANEVEANKMNREDYNKFETITNFIYEEFDLTFGNRILNQIEVLVPTYLACGGTKEEILDFLLTRKVLVKLEGRFEEYVKNSLKQLLNVLAKTYGKGVFKLSEKQINSMIRKL